MATYKIIEGGMHDRFLRSRKTVQILGGGYGNGKTAAACIKAISLCKDYPGSQGLIARATYPKLNDTIRREFFKWCPKHWVKRMPTKDDNTAYLTTGGTVNFRYVQQQGRTQEQTTSNLLSATYDWIIVDQMEDPEFAHKDFMDLMGRLRGTTEYVGDDPTMPRRGPQWIIITLNPTRNWAYRELVRPLHRFMDTKRPIIDPKLLCEVDEHKKAILDEDRRPIPIIDLIEGSTYENVDNVGEDYIRNMLATFTDSMAERYVYGKWGALSGLIYPTFDESVHCLEQDTILTYLNQLRRGGISVQWIEGYDHGLVVPTCYLLGFTDDDGNVFIIDGHYEKECPPSKTADRIHEIRAKWGVRSTELRGIYADPDIFRRKAGDARSVGVTVASIYSDSFGIDMRRGANDIASGIAKISQYLAQMPKHEHPITGQFGAPHLYINDRLDYVLNEFNEYRWNMNTSGDHVDTPVDKDDHAMDTIKYMFTDRPKLAVFTGDPKAPPAYMTWHEADRATQTTLPRHR